MNDYGLVYVNHKRPPFQDKKVSQALIYGLDRQKSSMSALNATERSRMFRCLRFRGLMMTKVSIGTRLTLKSQKLLDDAGWKTGKDGVREKRQKLEISYYTSKADDDFIPIAKENYADIGISLKPEVMDFNTEVAKINDKQYDLAAVSTSQILDPNDTVEKLASTIPIM